MRPIEKFLGKPKSFWASVRTLGEKIGYGARGEIIVPTVAQMAQAFGDLGLDPAKISTGDRSTSFADDLHTYFAARADALTNIAKPNLMSAAEAKAEFETHFARLQPKCPIPMNKQKGEKRAEAFLTALVNMMIEEHSGGMGCDYDPQRLTTLTRDGEPLRTLARRVDGAFPAILNPIAIWEIKEYYYTTTFGSRVAGGVYETLLDGMELKELREQENIDVKHYLMVDALDTWWGDGKPYLCRLFDMLHMGYVDEILFGREVVTEMPRIVAEWIALVRRPAPGP